MLLRNLKAAVVCIALAVAGCAGAPVDLARLVNLATVGVENPIGRTEYNAIVRTYTVLLRPAVAFVELPTCRVGQTFLRDGCGKYEHQVAVQAAIREAQRWRRELRRFVEQNDRINAAVAYRELVRALTLLRDTPKGD